MSYHDSRRKLPNVITYIIEQVKGLAKKPVKYLYLFLFALLGLLVVLETAEFKFGITDSFHIHEIVIYFVLLGIVGLLVELVSRASKVQPLHQKKVRLTKLILQKIETSVTKFARYFRLSIAIVLVMLVGVETAEFTFGISDTFHIGEIIIYFVLLGIMGVLVEIVLQAHKNQQGSINLLHYKHKMSLELLPYQNWDSLTSLLPKQLAEFIHARAAYLFFNRPLSDDSEPVGAALYIELGLMWDN